MSNRKSHNIKSSGQGAYRRQAEEIRKFFEYAGQFAVPVKSSPVRLTTKANIEDATALVRQVRGEKAVPVYQRKHRQIERETALSGELGVRIRS